MAFLNVDRALPPQLWALVRLLSARKSLTDSQVKALMSPDSLNAGKTDPPVQLAIRTSLELGLVVQDESGKLALQRPMPSLADFQHCLREILFSPARNTDLESDPISGNRDMTIVLSYFLSFDPLDSPVTRTQVDEISARSFSVEGKNPTPSNVRWPRFVHWVPMLGLGVAPLIPTSDSGTLTPDCTRAVRQMLARSGLVGKTVSAVDLVRRIREAIPVLPGGAYSIRLDIPDPGQQVVDPALSFALLRGEHEGWLQFNRFSDSASSVTIADRDKPNRRFSDIVVSESING
ncbi:protein DpdG [Amycolatopsis taiwanensis]|uniref:protein DpdG n=1 Tax=Amycolatopsis taiwanensis TaxID=342230 RepID=UPI000484B238|nr:protein DpdG [Amycolatopsis taiwanensis]